MRSMLALALPILVSCGGNVAVDVATGGQSGGLPTCETVCPKVQAACPGQSDSCAQMCATYDAFSGQGACLSETSEYFICLDGYPSFACNAAEGSCTAEDEDLSMCLIAFCDSHPGAC